MRTRDISIWASLYLALLLLLGGAGRHYPVLEAVEELGAIALLGLCWWRPEPPLSRLARAMVGVWLFCLGVAAAQLVPLPPALWTVLPDRELAAQIGREIGQTGLWRPVSLWPERTVAALLAVLPPGAMLAAALRLRVGERWRLVQIVVAAGLIGVLLGAVQFASGTGGGATPFTTDHQGNAIGLFVNRNHQATFLLVAMPFGTAWGAHAARRWGWAARLPALGYAVLLALGVVATTSRMGTALLPVTLLLAAVILFGDRLSWKGALAGALAAAALGYGALQSGTVQHTLGRFGAVEDERMLFWQDSLQAIRLSFPVGTGLGGFEPAHHAIERLEHVGPDVPNNAHNDYLELVMDAGLPAAVGLLVTLALVAALAARVTRLRRASDEWLLGTAGLGGIAIVLLCSIVDYPSRMTAVASLFALCAALACPSPPLSIQAPRRRPGVARPVFLVATGLLVASTILAAGISAHLSEEGDVAAARHWAPWASSPPSRLATEEFLAGRKSDAALLATRALASSPIDVAAVRTLALATEARQPARAATLMQLAGRLGWRDRLTQYWLMEHGFETGDLGPALTRTDALLRQDVMTDPLFAMLHRAVRDPAIAHALAERLLTQPRWAGAYLADVDRLPADQLADHARLLMLVARHAPAATRQGAARTAARLVALGRFDDAAALWRPFAGVEPIADGEFDDLAASKDDGPFGWHTATPVAVRVAAEMPDRPLSGAALHVHSDGVASGAVLSQLISLPPGRWMLRYASWRDSPQGGPPLEWRIGCAGVDAYLPLQDVGRTPTAPGWTIEHRALDLPPGGCRFQLLQLWSVSAGASDAWIDGVAVAPAHGVEGQHRRPQPSRQ